MAERSAIVVIVDRLGAGFLSSYGNTWLDTPEFDRLASQSLLCEQATSDSPQLSLVYRSYWQGWHAFCPDSLGGVALPGLLSKHGRPSTLLTDESEIAEHPLAAGFGETIVLAPPESAVSAVDADDTGLARIFAAAAERATSTPTPGLLWVHARGMSGPWDAPADFRRAFRHEDDPELPEFVTPPSYLLASNSDPDEVWGVVRAYAGQVALHDLALGMLLDALAEIPPAEQPLLILTSPRGYPLGEHSRVGEIDETLHGESLHVPWLLRLPDHTGALSRTQTLAQPPDLFATLAEWFDLQVDAQSIWGRSLLPLATGSVTVRRDRACSLLGAERAIRTPAWFLREGRERTEVYAKPDDRWEVNEVAVRCAGVVEELTAALRQFEQASQSTPFASFEPLSALLAEG